jgi:hypothetical protein
MKWDTSRFIALTLGILFWGCLLCAMCARPYLDTGS